MHKEKAGRQNAVSRLFSLDIFRHKSQHYPNGLVIWGASFFSISNLKYSRDWLLKTTVHSGLQVEYGCSALSKSVRPTGWSAPTKSDRKPFSSCTLKSQAASAQVQPCSVSYPQNCSDDV